MLGCLVMQLASPCLLPIVVSYPEQFTNMVSNDVAMLLCFLCAAAAAGRSPSAASSTRSATFHLSSGASHSAPLQVTEPA